MLFFLFIYSSYIKNMYMYHVNYFFFNLLSSSRKLLSKHIWKKNETEKGWGEPFIYCLQAHLLMQIYTSRCCQQRCQCKANLVTVTSCLVQLTLWPISDCRECCVLPPSITHCLDSGTIIFFLCEISLIATSTITESIKNDEIGIILFCILWKPLLITSDY